MEKRGALRPFLLCGYVASLMVLAERHSQLWTAKYSLDIQGCILWCILVTISSIPKPCFNL